MNKIIKKFTILPLIFLVGCTQKGVELDETQAKEQLSTMKTEISKDDFVIPTKYSLKTTVTTTVDGKEKETVKYDYRVNSEVGSRYIYGKGDVVMTTSTASETHIIYEKDNKFYGYSSENNTTKNVEYETEAEFKAAFDDVLDDFSVSPSNFKDGLINYIEMTEEFYEADTTKGTLEIKFTKYDESSFNCSVNYEESDKTTKAGIEFKNYLFTLLEYSEYEKTSKTELSIKGTMTYNTIDYIYPDQL